VTENRERDVAQRIFETTSEREGTTSDGWADEQANWDGYKRSAQVALRKKREINRQAELPGFCSTIEPD